MKTYTFKIKLQYPSENHPSILSLVHCPLEVLFDSLKQFKELEELYSNLSKPDNLEVPYFYITASDYMTDDFKDYISSDYILCSYKSILESKSLKDLLIHPEFLGFVDKLSSKQLKYIEPFKIRIKNKSKKGVKKNEV